MATNKLTSRTGEYELRLRPRGRANDREWVIELEFFGGKGKAELHTETNRTRAEGVFRYLEANGPDTCRVAERYIAQANFTE